jgi:hypothetical protein
MPIALCLLLAFATGCQSNSSIGSQSLANYGNLYAQGPTTLVYMQSDVSNFNAFLMEPAHVRADKHVKVRPAKLKQLATELGQTIHDDLAGAGYSLVERPQPGIIRIRVVLAQLTPTSALYTQTDKHVTQGLQPGQAVVEAEILSLDGKTQLGAVVIADEHHPVTLKDLLDEKTRKDIYKAWALQLRLRIDEMHGRSTM